MESEGGPGGLVPGHPQGYNPPDLQNKQVLSAQESSDSHG